MSRVFQSSTKEHFAKGHPCYTRPGLSVRWGTSTRSCGLSRCRDMELFYGGTPKSYMLFLDVSINHPAIYLWKPPQYPQLLISNTMYPVESCATSHQLPLPRSTFRWQHIVALLVLPTRRTRSRREFGTFSWAKKNAPSRRHVATPNKCAEKWKSLEIPFQFFGKWLVSD